MLSPLFLDLENLPGVSISSTPVLFGLSFSGSQEHCTKIYKEQVDTILFRTVAQRLSALSAINFEFMNKQISYLLF